jgi:putative peptidoglycan lipid II flippase
MRESRGGQGADRGSGAARHVARSALLVSVLFAADKLLALVRDRVIGRTFGTSAELDAYYAAFEVPDGLFTVVAGAAMATALIPVISARIARRDREGTWKLFSSVINSVLLVVAAASVLAAVGAPQIIRWVAPGFDRNTADLAVRLMRLVLLQTLVSSASGIVMSTLQAHQHFLLPAVAPMAYTVGRIGGALYLAPRWGIFGLAYGGLAGTVGHLLIQLPGLYRYRCRWRPVLRHPDLGAVLSLLGPRVLGIGTTYLTFVVPTWIGSWLEPGAIASYEYGWRLMQFPETIVGTAVGLTVFPALAERANAGDESGLRRTAGWALRLVLALAIPAAAGLVVLGRPLTAVLLQGGAFDDQATARVYWALAFFAPALVGHAALEVVSRTYFARRDVWTPFWAAVAGLGVNVMLGWALLTPLKHGALALSNGLGALAQVALLLVTSRWRRGGFEGRALLPLMGRTTIATVAMVVVVVGIRLVLAGAGLVVNTAAALAAGSITYLAVALLVRIREVRDLPSLLLGRRKEGATPPGLTPSAGQ